MRCPRALAGLGLLALLAAPLPAAAQVTCSGGNVALNFGTYEGFSTAPVDVQASLVVTCNRSGGPQFTTITVGLGPSATSGQIPNRRLAGPMTNQMNYNLYRDATRLSVWGNTGGTDTVSQTLAVPNNSSASATFTIYGRLFAAQDVRAGFYSDSLIATVTY
jgi:spore coat protein U-like protein